MRSVSFLSPLQAIVRMSVLANCLKATHNAEQKRWVVTISIHNKYDIPNVYLLYDTSEGRTFHGMECSLVGSVAGGKRAPWVLMDHIPVRKSP